VGPWFPNVNLYLYTEKRKKGRKETIEGPPRYDNARSLARLTENFAAGGKRGKGGGRQKRIMDTMLDGAHSGSRRAGACTRPGEPSKRLRRVDVYLLSATSKRRATIIDVQFNLLQP